MNNRLLQKFLNIYFWCDKIEFVRQIIHKCGHCQMVQEFESIGSRIEDLKNISVYDLFYKVVLTL
jgi:hypothetical protein